MSENKNTSENKYPCGLVRDLLPLYRDNVCGEESRRIVEAHLAECADCPKILEQLDDNSVEELLTRESNTVLSVHRKKERRAAVTAGLITSGILFIPMIVCLICDLASGHGLSWFFIVLTSLMLAASVTVVPMLSGRYRFSKMFAGFLISLFLLLLSCCVYTGGDWLLVAAVPTIFGVSALSFHFVVRELPLPDALKNRKLLITLLWDTFWLLATLAVCCAYTGGNWFGTAASGCILGLSLGFMPALIHRIPLPKLLKNQKALLVMIWNTLWLYVLVFGCARYVKPDDIAYYFHNSVWITSLCLLVPWTIFILARYLRLHPMIKAGIIMILCWVFSVTANDLIMLVYLPKGGIYSPSVIRDFIAVIGGSRPSDLAFGITTIVFGALLMIGIVFIAIGAVRSSKKRKK